MILGMIKHRRKLVTCYRENKRHFLLEAGFLNAHPFVFEN
jgi:DNA integrity scanning protein DisA with diadenylate cyclase activity